MTTEVEAMDSPGRPLHWKENWGSKTKGVHCPAQLQAQSEKLHTSKALQVQKDVGTCRGGRAASVIQWPSGILSFSRLENSSLWTEALRGPWQNEDGDRFILFETIKFLFNRAISRLAIFVNSVLQPTSNTTPCTPASGCVVTFSLNLFPPILGK